MRGTSSGFVEIGKYFTEAVFIFIDGNKQSAAANPIFGSLANGHSLSRLQGTLVTIPCIALESFENLVLAGLIPVNSYSLAIELISEFVGLVDILGFCVSGKVYRFGNGIIGMSLKCRLDFDMPIGRYFMSRNHQAGQLLWYLIDRYR